jgi:hypothetical protein
LVAIGEFHGLVEERHDAPSGAARRRWRQEHDDQILRARAPRRGTPEDDAGVHVGADFEGAGLGEHAADDGEDHDAMKV